MIGDWMNHLSMNVHHNLTVAAKKIPHKTLVGPNHCGPGTNKIGKLELSKMNVHVMVISRVQLSCKVRVGRQGKSHSLAKESHIASCTK